MKKKYIIFLTILLLSTGLLTYGVHWAFFDTQRIEGQELLAKSHSPNDTYTITAYLNNGGATTSYAVLCVVINNQTRKSKNIYWEYGCDTVDIAWFDDATVMINDITLDVNHDVYDFRGK